MQLVLESLNLQTTFHFELMEMALGSLTDAVFAMGVTICDLRSLTCKGQYCALLARSHEVYHRSAKLYRGHLYKSCVLFQINS